MSATVITTNHHPRPLLCVDELPAGVRAKYFDYVDEDSQDGSRFFQYREYWYDAYEFTMAPDDLKARGWDGVQPNSYWSGIAVQWFNKDGEPYEDEIVVASLYWG